MEMTNFFFFKSETFQSLQLQQDSLPSKGFITGLVSDEDTCNTFRLSMSLAILLIITRMVMVMGFHVLSLSYSFSKTGSGSSLG